MEHPTDPMKLNLLESQEVHSVFPPIENVPAEQFSTPVLVEEGIVPGGASLQALRRSISAYSPSPSQVIFSPPLHACPGGHIC